MIFLKRRSKTSNWQYLVIKSITDKGIYGINEKKERMFVENSKLEPSLLEEIKNLNYNTEIDVKVGEDGDIPQIIGLNSSVKTGEVKIEEVKEKLEERPPLEKELEEGLSKKAELIEKLVVDKDLELKKLTAQTIQVLIGKVDLENIEEVISKIYNIYKNLK